MKPIEFCTIPGIAALCYGLVELLKRTFRNNACLKNAYPLIAALTGALLGVLLYLLRYATAHELGAKGRGRRVFLAEFPLHAERTVRKAVARNMILVQRPVGQSPVLADHAFRDVHDLAAVVLQFVGKDNHGECLCRLPHGNRKINRETAL